MRAHASFLQVAITLLLAVAQRPSFCWSSEWATDPQHPYDITNGAITKPLTTEAGDPARGRQVVLDRERGDCVVCHLMPLPERQFHGTVGPPLDTIGKRVTANVLRLQLVNPKATNPQTVMPAYFRTHRLYHVLTQRRDRTILTAQEVEDVVAYLLTLTDETSAVDGQGAPPRVTATEHDSQTKQSWTTDQEQQRRSGYAYLSEDNQRLQNDEFANPGMLWVERGKELWAKPDGTTQHSCASCHEDASVSMRGVSPQYPRFDPERKKLINLEQRIIRCRTKHMGALSYPYESDALLALTTFLSFQSRNLPIRVKIDGPARPFFVAGRTFFMQRRGQLDLACTHCHDQLTGQRLRGEVISQGQINGFPIYRHLWQTLGSRHRMFAWCNTAIRAEPPPLGSDDYVNLELYMTWRARGLPVESPAIRR